jgi:hypothetical protein
VDPPGRGATGQTCIAGCRDIGVDPHSRSCVKNPLDAQVGQMWEQDLQIMIIAHRS